MGLWCGVSWFFFINIWLKMVERIRSPAESCPICGCTPLPVKWCQDKDRETGSLLPLLDHITGPVSIFGRHTGSVRHGIHFGTKASYFVQRLRGTILPWYAWNHSWLRVWCPSLPWSSERSNWSRAPLPGHEILEMMINEWMAVGFSQQKNSEVAIILSPANGIKLVRFSHGFTLQLQSFLSLLPL